jgi:hypothetical protein
MNKLSAGLFLLGCVSVSGTYVVTCHNNGECGTVCGSYSDDIAAPTEGLFGTSCSCQTNSGYTQVCTAFNQAITQCADGKAPNCKTSCGQKICVAKDGKKATATILSACPKHHPENVKNCCSHPSSRDYCTCVIQDTLDLNWKPYQALGNSNGYSSSANWGACGSVLESLQIDINTTRASDLVQPFLKSGEWCKAETAAYQGLVEFGCSGLDADECSAKPGCSYCTSLDPLLPSQCYETSEAEVLTHIVSTERHVGDFVCSKRG